MEKTTILEKFKIIFEISKSSKLFIAVIAFIILLAIVALTTNKKNAKRGKSIYALVYASILVSLIVVYHESLGKMFDYMMDNFFIVLYFPNVAVYMAAIVITNIILWTSVFNFRTSKLVRTTVPSSVRVRSLDRDNPSLIWLPKQPLLPGFPISFHTRSAPPGSPST